MHNLPRVGALACTLLLTTSGVAHAGDPFEVEITQPLPGASVVSDLSIGVVAETAFEIVSGTAQVGVNTLDLSPGSCSSVCWGASVPIEPLSLPPGTNTIFATLENVFGEVASAESEFFYAVPPTITHVSPQFLAVATPEFEAQILCSDADGGPCVSMTARVSSGAFGGVFLGEDPEEISGVFDLSSMIGQKQLIRVSAEGAYGSVLGTADNSSVAVYVENNARLQEVESVDGLIRAVDERFVVYVAGLEVVLRDRESREETVIHEIPFQGGLGGIALTDSGAIFAAAVGGSQPFPSGEVLEWRDSELLTHGPTTAVRSFRGNENWAVWSTNRDLWRLDLESGAIDLVSSDVRASFSIFGPTGGWVGENGTVAFSETDRYVYQFRGDQKELVAASRDPTFPRTDGDLVVWLTLVESSPFESSCHIDLWDGVKRETLTQSSNCDFRVRNGWVAFSQSSLPGGIQQIWLRRPDGQVLQRTFFSSAVELLCLGPQGEIIFGKDERNHYLPADAPESAFGIEIGHLFIGATGLLDCQESWGAGDARGEFIDGELHIALASSVFRVMVPEPAAALLQAAALAGLAALRARQSRSHHARGSSVP